MNTKKQRWFSAPWRVEQRLWASMNISRLVSMLANFNTSTILPITVEISILPCIWKVMHSNYSQKLAIIKFFSVSQSLQKNFSTVHWNRPQLNSSKPMIHNHYVISHHRLTNQCSRPSIFEKPWTRISILKCWCLCIKEQTNSFI